MSTGGDYDKAHGRGDKCCAVIAALWGVKYSGSGGGDNTGTSER